MSKLSLFTLLIQVATIAIIVQETSAQFNWPSFPVSTDGKCGWQNGKSCPSGQCCDRLGTCGTESAFCDWGCQLAYGTCSPGSDHFDSASDSTDGKCGPAVKRRCPVTKGQCCNKNTNTCGTGAESCAPSVCEFGYGLCYSTRSTPTTGGAAAVLETNCATPGLFALTFDDGPWAYTKGLSDYLVSEGVRATFFVNGNSWGNLLSPYWGQVVRDLVAAGHQVASHTWEHASLETSPSEVIYAEIMTLEEILQGILGFAPTHMRPPFGEWSDTGASVVGNLGYRAFTWNVDSNDWSLMDPAREMDNYRAALEGKSASSSAWMSLNHDSVQSTSDTSSTDSLVRQLIPYVKGLGYNITTVADCVGVSNPYKTL